MSHLLGGTNTSKEAIVDVSNGLCPCFCANWHLWTLAEYFKRVGKSLLLKSYLQRFFGSLSVKDSPPSTLLGIAYEDRVLMLHDI